MEQPKESPDQKPPKERKKRKRWPLLTFLILLILLLLSLRACSYVKGWQKEVSFSEVKTVTEDAFGRTLSRLPFIGKRLLGEPALTGGSAVGGTIGGTTVSVVSGGQAVTGLNLGADFLKGLKADSPVVIDNSSGSSLAGSSASSSGSRGQGTLILSATLRDQRGKLLNPKIRFSSGAVVVEPERAFIPGLYTLKVTVTNPLTTQTQTLTQNFAWGVLAMNTNQDRYETGDKAQVAIGVLDDAGQIVCDAKVGLSVTDPDGTVTQLSTTDQSVRVTGTCGRKEAGLISPDYEAFFSVTESGTYTLKLTAETKNGTREMTQRIAVSDERRAVSEDSQSSTIAVSNISQSSQLKAQSSSWSVIISRKAATRLWPFAPSPMEITVQFNEDFSGEITDTVPGSFTVLTPAPSPASSWRGVPSVARRGEDGTGEQTITWKGSWKAGETAVFRYDYDAPDESPQFFLVGPLRLEAMSNWQLANSQQLQANSRALLEQRSWQIANDANSNVYWIGTNTVGSDSWSDITKWSLSSGGAACSCTPDSTDIATFDGTRVGNVSVDVNANIGGVNIGSGYTGTISQSASRTITLGISGWTQAAGTFTGGNSAIIVGGSFILTGGVFTSTTGTMSVQASFSHLGGTFTHNSGTVQLTGGNQTLSGSTTFNNLTKTVTYASTLTFAATTTQTVAGTLTLKGSAGNYLSLRSTLPGVQWNINPQAGRVISYLDVQDSNNANATVIDASNTNSISSGNNTNWNFGWNSGDWLYRKKITISNTNVDANLTNFPLYVKISNDTAIGPKARADGYDIRFTDSGGTLIPYERETYSYGTGSGSGNFWVKVPSISTSAPTYIFIYYGNSSASDGQAASSVWDSNYAMVQHMKDTTTSTITDSKGTNNGTKKNANEPIEATGKIDKGQDFDGQNDHVDLGNTWTPLNTGNPYTVSFWAYWPTTQTYPVLLHLRSNGDAVSFYFATAAGGDYQGILFGSPSTWGKWHENSTDLAGNWVYAVFTYNGQGATTIGNFSIYKNGAVRTLVTAGSFGTGDARNLIGDRSTTPVIPFKGVLDEVRVSSAARSAAWIKFEYCNMGGGACTDNALTWEGQAAGQTPPAEAQTTGYNIRTDVVAAGGGEKAKSNNYMLDDTIGEANIGLSKTANYSLNAGYRQAAQAGPYISLSCSATVTLPSIAPGSQSTGSGTCIVTTDADAGYSLSWAVLTGSGGTNTGYLVSHTKTIAPYTPAVSGTPETWSVAAADSEWGGRLRSNSTDTLAKWGTDASSPKWLDVPALTNATVVTRSSRTALTGSTEILQYRTEIGASTNQATGTYRATITMTAVAL